MKRHTVVSTVAAGLVFWCLHIAESYKPVILMHGVGDSASEMGTIASLLKEYHPGTVVTSLALYEGSPASWDHGLQTQVEGVAGAIRALVAADPKAYAEGYHLVCKSQGGLTCRCVIQFMADHRVDTFVSLAGPQDGVYGPDFFTSITKKIPLLADLTAKLMYLVAYNSLGQKISVGDIWRDPAQLQKYMSGNTFLPRYTDAATPAMRDNFLRIKKAVFCVGSGPAYDGGIEPWQSGVFGGKDANGNMLTMQEQPFYTADTFGLRTLDQSGSVNLTIVSNVKHHDWDVDVALIKAYVLPHCT